MVAHRSPFRPIARLVGSLLILSALVAGPAEAATFVVNSTGDEAAAAPIDGVACNSTVGTCTLRAAIEEANAAAGLDIIHFNIAGPVPLTIVLGSALPALSAQVTIDGTTQRGWVNAGPTRPSSS